MTATPDQLNALMDFLKADAAVSAAVGTRVFGGELPKSESVNMPRACVVLALAGTGIRGSSGFGYMKLDHFRVDAFCYGASPYGASVVYRAVYGALKQMRRNVQGDTMLLCASMELGAQSLRDPDAEWPYTLSSWSVLASEEVIA